MIIRVLIHFPRVCVSNATSFDFNAALKKIERGSPPADINFPTRKYLSSEKYPLYAYSWKGFVTWIAYASFSYNRIAAINIDKHRWYR